MGRNSIDTGVLDEAVIQEFHQRQGTMTAYALFRCNALQFVRPYIVQAIVQRYRKMMAPFLHTGRRGNSSR